MALPEQVRRQAERANELLNQAYGTTGDPTEEPASQEPQVQEPVEPAPEPTPAAPAEPAPAPVPPVASDWEQKYRTLQGVFNAESGRWNAEKKVFETRIATLETAMTAQPAAPAPTATAPTDDKDVETYGSELVDMVSRKAEALANKIVEQRMAELKPQLDQTREQVTNVTAHVYRSKEEKFYGELTKSVSDWESINDDPRWKAWLGEVDPLSGVQRQAYIEHAQKNMDHAHVATLFNAFKDAAGMNKPAPQAPAGPALSPSPRTVGNASAPTHREPVTSVARSEIAAHYRRAASDREYRGGADHAAFEARIQQAMATNQIIEA